MRPDRALANAHKAIFEIEYTASPSAFCPAAAAGGRIAGRYDPTLNGKPADPLHLTGLADHIRPLWAGPDDATVRTGLTSNRGMRSAHDSPAR